MLDRISEAVTKGTDYFLFILSKNSIASEWCKLELRMAYDKEVSLKRVVVLPIRIDDAEIPSEVKTKKYYQLESENTFSLNSLIQEIKSLVKSQKQEHD